MSSLSTLKITVKGHVQGVFFRDNAKDLAGELGLTGWAINEPGGHELHIVIQGPEEFTHRFVKWCHDGPAHAKVESVDVKEDFDAEIYEGFKIRY
jgi:acylphosphatase